jgi:hypothetical protein
MRREFIAFIALLLLLKINAQQAEQKILVTLQKGEEPLYSESYIPMSFSGGALKLVTRANGQFYYYENGTRKGPFKDAKSIPLGNRETSSITNSGCTAIQIESNDFDKFVQIGSDGRYRVMYNGKTYTEFSQVTQIAVAENQKIAVLGTNDAEELLFLSPDGKIIPVAGEPDKIIISPQGTMAIAVVKGTKTRTSADTDAQMENMQKMVEEFQSVDFASMTPEQMEAFTKQLQQKYGIEDNNQPQQPDYYFYLSNGKKLGPFKLDGSTYNNPSFNVSGAENWYFTDGSKLYINGLMVKDFGESSPSTCSIWLSSDGKRWAAFLGYEKLVFCDGQSFPAPLNIEVKTESGKTYLTWITLNTSNQIVLYKKAI